MKEIVVISGKGGTGKTSLTATYSYLGGKDVVTADCDVDASDMHLLLQPDFNNRQDYYSGFVAEIDKDACLACGKCIDVCRFDAISSDFDVDAINCEGCGYCQHVCPKDAIKLEEQNIGNIYVSKTKAKGRMVHAELGIGADNSGKLVSKVKNEARDLADKLCVDTLIVDGSPGIGCPVIASLSGASYVVLVTEPSVSGFHDLKRVYKLVKDFELKAGCIINKYDLNLDITAQIKDFLSEEKITHIASFPYDERFSKAMTQGKTIVEYDKWDLNDLVKQSWNKIQELV